MEASALTHASRGGLLGRRSPLLRLQGDERLVALIRAGNDNAFETLFERYHSRLLAFCRHMLRSTEDAEDVLQEVFVKAHGAMLADNRHINVRPWLYRIARNRCLNHLRKPVPEGQDSMDILPGDNGATTADRVQTREDFRALVADVQELPETQRTALLLREIDALSYEEIAESMTTTVPAVKSLLVRARISLAEATHSRQLTCGEVRLELAEAAEGLGKATGPVRHHVKRCDQCHDFRKELRANGRALAALAPLGPLAALHQLIVAKLGGFGGSSTAAGGTAVAGSGGAAGGGAAAGAGGIAAAGAGGTAAGAGGAAAGIGSAAAAAGGTAAAGTGAAAGAAAAGAGGIGGALGAKAAATAAAGVLLTAGAVEVKHIYSDQPADTADRVARTAFSPPPERGAGSIAPAHATISDAHVTSPPASPAEQTDAPEPAPAPAVEAAPAPAETAPPPAEESEGAVSTPPEAGEGSTGEVEPAGQAPLEATASPADQAGTTTPPAYQPPPTSSTSSSTTTSPNYAPSGSASSDPGNPPSSG